jgi:hypothetical protein
LGPMEEVKITTVWGQFHFYKKNYPTKLI